MEINQNVNVIRQRTMTVSDTATPFGCCNFFDRCTDEILSLHYHNTLGLLDWMGFNVSDECYRSVEFITYVRPANSAEQGYTASAGYLSDPCADPNGFEFGTCKLTVEDFGRYGRMGPTREIMKPRRYCKTDPRRRLDGQLITDEREWDMAFAMDTLLHDIQSHLIIGNANVAGQFDGLNRWVKTGYDCGSLDSYVINWNSNPMSGGAGMTWNGNAIAPTFDFIDVLMSVVRRIRRRVSWSRLLSRGRMLEGDMILVMPDFMTQCILDFYTCWSVCPGQQYNEANLNTYEARQFRDAHLGGLFGAGFITIDNYNIHLMPYDWELIKGPTRGDIFLLTGAVGPTRIWEGEHLDANVAIRELGGNATEFFSTDGGRVIGRIDTENLCRQLKLWLHPRLFCLAPWAQARFMNVSCTVPGGPLSADPLETSFYPETSFHPAEC